MPFFADALPIPDRDGKKQPSGPTDHEMMLKGEAQAVLGSYREASHRGTSGG